MPNVNGKKKFPYTKKGIAAANAMRMQEQKKEMLEIKTM